jgi:hypothetical protein
MDRHMGPGEQKDRSALHDRFQQRNSPFSHVLIYGCHPPRRHHTPTLQFFTPLRAPFQCCK